MVLRRERRTRSRPDFHAKTRPALRQRLSRREAGESDVVSLPVNVTIDSRHPDYTAKVQLGKHQIRVRVSESAEPHQNV